MVQRGVGGSQQIGQFTAGVASYGGDTDGDGQPDGRRTRISVDRNGHVSHMVTQALRDAEGVVLSRLREKEHELLATEPARAIVGAQLTGKRFAKRSQDPIPNQVTMGVVHDLEMIDVNQRYRDRTPRPYSPVKLAFVTEATGTATVLSVPFQE